MARYAGLLGKADDQAKYAELAKSAGTAFNSHFFDAVNATYREAGRSCKQYLSPQTAISLADELGLIPAEQVQTLVENQKHQKHNLCFCDQLSFMMARYNIASICKSTVPTHPPTATEEFR